MDIIHEQEENYLPLNMNETSQSSPLLSYKLDKYRKFYHPIESPLLKLQNMEGDPSLTMVDFPEISSKDSSLILMSDSIEKKPLRIEFKDIHLKDIKDVILSPSPRSKKKAINAKSEEKKKLKSAKSCLFGIFNKKDSKEVKKWWINSPQYFSIIATTYHSFKYFELPPYNPMAKCLSYFKKFPKLEDLSINVETFAELGQNNTLLIRNLISMQKISNIRDLRIVSFPGEKTLWHGPAFLFNAVMGFNMRDDENEATNSRLEIWHRFRSYFDRGAFQDELIDIIKTINIRLKEEKLEVLHLILSSSFRITDKILSAIEENLTVFLRDVSEFKLLISGRSITNYGVKNLCEHIESLNPKKIKSFHFFLDYRSNSITEQGILSVCHTILKLAETNIIEYLSLGFLSTNLRDNDMVLLGDALRLLSKTLRSLVIIVSGNMTDNGLNKLLDGVLDGPYLRKICLGFMGSNLTGNKDFLINILEAIKKKAISSSLYLFHFYFNNTKGVRNLMLEGVMKEKLGIYKEVELETYIFC